MPLYTFAIKLFYREWRSGALRLIILAMIIAVSALTTIQFQMSRLEIAITQQANTLIAADRELRSSTLIDSSWITEAQNIGLQTAQTLTFPSVVSHDQQFQLSNVKAVTTDYPLRGNLRSRVTRLGTDIETTDIPKQGTVWVEARLLDLLDIELGDTLNIGYADFIVERIITYEPDQGGGIFNIAPRVFMYWGDVAQTQVIQPASRVTYRLLVAGSELNLQQYEQWVAPRLQANQQFNQASDARPGLQKILQTAKRYLYLASLFSVLLAGIAIALAAREFAKRHYLSSALLRCYGATKNQVFSIYAIGLFVLGTLASLVGSTVGLGLHYIIDGQVQQLLNTNLPPPTMMPFFTGILTGLIILFSFALPPLLGLRLIPPIAVLRQQIKTARKSNWQAYLFAAIAMITLLYFYINDWLLTAYVTVGSLIGGGILWLIAYITIHLLHFLPRKVGIGWRYGVNSLLRRPNSNSLQIVSFGVVIMAILVLAIVRGDLLNNWQQQLPDDAPNYFLTNIQPNEVATVNTILEQHGFANSPIYPMVRGRLTAINNVPTIDAVPESQRDHNALRRELNLSWVDEIPPNNSILEGDWWQEGQGSVISVESALAKTLNLKMGDRLTFQVGAEKISATISNLRLVDWESFQPNFYVLFTPEQLTNFPAQYMTSFYLPIDSSGLLRQLITEIPTLTLIDVTAFLEQADFLLQKAALLIEMVFLFSLLAGIILLLTTIQSTREERLQELTLLRTLGASNKLIRTITIAEFATLGLLAGIFAAASATLIGWALATYLFKIPYQISLMLWTLGITSSLLLITGIGLLSTKKLRQEPVHRHLWRIN